MADGLFDNRYRYDYIYPRGRSGETLRAVDLQDDERRVVIKRPGANDAPPIRAGQEVSIMNERRALQRLSGHAVLTELVGEGQFFVGGTTHQYIVMERADGLIIADLVSELNANGDRMPTLEALVIVDQMLDLLEKAHHNDIVYNDVDAKHLFWNRSAYRLKVIDWGNAVFLEGDDATPQGISRQTDIFQTGELLYFILTGGRRADIPRDAGPEFRLDFGEDSQRVHSMLQEIVSRAANPNTKHRYQTIKALRSDLTKFRQPLESDRNATIATITQKLNRDNLSKSELRTLRTMIEPVIEQDPGYPPARTAHDDIVNRLRDLNVEADLDAVRIYIQSENWQRALDLLVELRDKTGSQTRGLVSLLEDVTQMLVDNRLPSYPLAIKEALADLFDGKAQSAANRLLTDLPMDGAARSLQWLVAERISSHMPDVLLLRPNLYRLRVALRQLERDGVTIHDAQTLLDEIDSTLDKIAGGSINLHELREAYRHVVELIQSLNPILQTMSIQYQLNNHQLPITSMDRALNAAMALADNMHVIGKQAAASPRDALQALEISRAVDPPNPVWDDIRLMLEQLYTLLESSQTYVPAADGTDLQDWLQRTHDQLQPFSERVFDDLLGNMLRGITNANKAWRRYRAVVVSGDRDEADNALATAARSVATISPALSAWFEQLRRLIEGSQYIERHSIPGGTGRALADGWQAFDRGRLSDSERLGQQAFESARSEEEREAARRLLELSRTAREWVERGGINSISRTQNALNAVEKLFTGDERETLDDFTRQMPSTETYLKAMSRGLTGIYQRRSTAALRLLFMQYVLLGTLDMHDEKVEDAIFWREAAARTLGKLSENHAAVRALDEFIETRRDIVEASNLLGKITGREVLPELESIRKQLEDNSQVNMLAPGIQSLRDVEMALRDWQDGDFRNAGMKMEKAVNGINEVEQSANLTLTGYRAWLLELMEAAAELHLTQREMRTAIDQKPDQPPGEIGAAFRRMASVTENLLGADYAGQLRQWRDTYDRFVSIYTGDERRSRRLDKLNELFRAMFIDRHPAYALFRHWYAQLEASPEFPAPPTDDPTPRIDENDDIDEEAYRYEPPTVNVTHEPVTRRKRRRFSPLMLLLGVTVIAGVGLLVVLALTNGNNEQGAIDVTISPTPEEVTAQETDATPVETSVEVAAVDDTPTLEVTDVVTVAPTQNTAAVVPTDEPAPTLTHTSTVTQTEAPTLQPTATMTVTSTFTPEPPTPTPLPPEGVTGQVDILPLLEDTDEVFYNPNLFIPLDSGWRMGTGEATDNDILYIMPPEDFFEERLGNNAASRVRRIEATFTLRSFNPEIVGPDDLYFGLLLQSTDDGNNAGVQMQVVGNNVINLSQMRNNDATFVNQRAVDRVSGRLRIDRDQSSGDVQIYFNDVPIGQPFEFIDAEAPVLPVLFVREGGVVLGVTDWRVYLR